MPYQSTAKLKTLMQGTKFHVGYLIAIGVTILLFLLVYKTKFGYEVRVSGSNLDFASIQVLKQPCDYLTHMQVLS